MQFADRSRAAKSFYGLISQEVHLCNGQDCQATGYCIDRRVHVTLLQYTQVPAEQVMLAHVYTAFLLLITGEGAGHPAGCDTRNKYQNQLYTYFLFNHIHFYTFSLWYKMVCMQVVSYDPLVGTIA